MNKIKSKCKTMCAVMVCALAICAGAETDPATRIRMQFDNIHDKLPAKYLVYGVLEETIDELYKEPTYAVFADVVTNDWAFALANLGQIATNDVERLLILGVGLHYDENFYLDFFSTLCDMRTNGLITAEEFISGWASHRHDLNSCLIRRYQEPKVVELVNKLKIAMPQQESRWNDILSGAAYTNYLEEVAIGLWQ